MFLFLSTVGFFVFLKVLWSMGVGEDNLSQLVIILGDRIISCPKLVITNGKLSKITVSSDLFFGGCLTALGRKHLFKRAECLQYL